MRRKAGVWWQLQCFRLQGLIVLPSSAWQRTPKTNWGSRMNKRLTLFNYFLCPLGVCLWGLASILVQEMKHDWSLMEERAGINASCLFSHEYEKMHNSDSVATTQRHSFIYSFSLTDSVQSRTTGRFRVDCSSHGAEKTFILTHITRINLELDKFVFDTLEKTRRKPKRYRKNLKILVDYMMMIF